jgi:hypothetical protein
VLRVVSLFDRGKGNVDPDPDQRNNHLKTHTEIEIAPIFDSSVIISFGFSI